MPHGWSKAGAERAGRSWRPANADGEECYYCGVLGCDECGRPPAVLAESDIIRSRSAAYDEQGAV